MKALVRVRLGWANVPGALMLAGLLVLTGCIDSHYEAWLDEATGWLWQNPAITAGVGASEAENYCDALVFDGREDWHLPTISELRSLIRDCPATMPDGACPVTDSCLTPTCENAECPGCGIMHGCLWPEGLEGKCENYYSSSRVEGSMGNWVVGFLGGFVGQSGVGSINAGDLRVRCVSGTD